MLENTTLRTSLHNFIKRKDYKNCYFVLKKIYAILENEKRQKSDNNQNPMRDCTLETNLDILKISLRNDIMFLLINKRHISLDMIKLIKTLDKNYEDTIKTIVCNEIVKCALLRFRKGHENILVAKNIAECYSEYEEMIDDLKVNYSHFPFSWNLLGEFTYSFCKEMKEILLHTLYSKEWKRVDIISMLKDTIMFETKTTQYCYVDCCLNDKKIIFKNADVYYNNSGEIIHNNEFYEKLQNKKPETDYNVPIDFKTTKGIFCDHKKILSRTFAPFFRFYVEELFKSINSINFVRDKQETYIYDCFINFFRQLSEILIKVRYFNDTNLLDNLVSISNFYLTELLEKITKSKAFTESCICLNSLIYVEEAFNDFLTKITKKTNKNYTSLSCIRTIRSLEKNEYRTIDQCIDTFLKKLFKDTANYTFNQQVYVFLSNNLFDLEFHELNENLVRLVIEIMFQAIFSHLIQVRMDIELSEFFLIELVELKKSLSTKTTNIPFIDTIERYLKIFLVSPSQVNDFIENFELFSRNTFNFSQILKILKDEENNIDLFLEYKKHN